MHCLSLSLIVLALTAVVATAAEPKGEPPDPAVAKRLEWFQDLKFGLFMHWGEYSQLGCIESWPLVWEDRSLVQPHHQDLRRDA